MDKNAVFLLPLQECIFEGRRENVRRYKGLRRIRKGKNRQKTNKMQFFSTFLQFLSIANVKNHVIMYTGTHV